MRNIAETSDGMETIKLATVAAALLIPPIFMMVAAPQQPATPANAAQITKPSDMAQSVPEQPMASSSSQTPDKVTHSS